MDNSEPEVSQRTKQVIVIRRDLKCRRGKEVSQGSHASMAFLSKRTLSGEAITDVQREWLNNSFAKVTCQVDSLEELLAIKQKADELGVECHVIEDSGRTEFKGQKTVTCLAVGPDYEDRINPITGHLKLY